LRLGGKNKNTTVYNDNGKLNKVREREKRGGEKGKETKSMSCFGGYKKNKLINN